MATDHDQRFEQPTCHVCGAPTTEPAKFCHQCGSSLTFPSQRTPWRLANEEWRQVTVLFCDLVGSTSLSVDLPPEDLRDITRTYRETSSAIIRAHGGWIGSFEGDGIIAYFGYPKASEDSAVQSCRAGLRLVIALEGQRLQGVHLRVRVACATGLVVAADGSDLSAIERHAITGSAPNLAARLQTIAPVGGLVVTQDTRMLLGDVFETKDLGLHTLKGIPRAVHVWRVVKERPIESRFARRSDASRGPAFIGRARDLDILLDGWSSAMAGAGQVVYVVGEAGIGKSRLVQALREAIAGQPFSTRLYQCSQAQSSSILHPVIAQIEYAANITARDTPARKLSKLEGLFSTGDADGDLLIRLLAELMAISSPGVSTEPEIAPQQKRALMLAALIRQVDRLAAAGPVLLVLEDAQWIDPTTHELIAKIMARVHTIAVLLVITSRQAPDADSFGVTPTTHVNLARLRHDETIALVTALTAGKTLPGPIVAAIAERTNGIPLFVEEFTKTVLDSPAVIEGERDFVVTSDIHSLTLPTTLRDCLMERLDQLTAGKDLLQIGAILGHAFSYELIARLCNRDRQRLVGELHGLVEAGLLVMDEESLEPRYAFRHALIQEAAHDSLLPSTRRDLHARVAAVLREAFSDRIEAAPELLARHLSGADAHAEAAPEWHRAGIIALQRSAIREAVLHFNNALATLKRMPLAQRDQERELDMLVHLAGALRALLSYASPEVARLCRRALKLARTVKSSTGELQALNGLYSFHLVRSEYGMAEKRAHEMLSVAERAAEPTYTMVAHRAVGAVSFHTGRLNTAEQSLRRALKFYNKDRHAYLATAYGSDHAETCACFLSLTLWVRGAAHEAIAQQEWTVQHATSINHAHSLAQAYAYRAFLYCLVGDIKSTRSDAREALAVASANDLLLMRVFAECLLAVADASETVTLDSTAGLLATIDRLDDAAPKALRPYLLTIVADLYRRLGRIDLGLSAVDEADAIICQTTERWAAGEVYRVRGTLLAGQGRDDLAERCFRTAINIARAQSAGSWVARATRDLSELLTRTGRIAEISTGAQQAPS